MNAAMSREKVELICRNVRDIGHLAWEAAEIESHDTAIRAALEVAEEREQRLRTALVRAGEIIHDILCAREHAQVCRDITDTLAARPAPPPFDEPDLWKTEIGEAWALVQELGYPDAAMRSPEFEMFLSDGYWQARFAPGEYWGGGDTAGAAIRDAAAHWKQHNLPYPGWCRHPEQCAGKASCPEDPTCAD